jgi:hypothetical protein
MAIAPAPLFFASLDRSGTFLERLPRLVQIAAKGLQVIKRPPTALRVLPPAANGAALRVPLSIRPAGNRINTVPSGREPDLTTTDRNAMPYYGNGRPKSVDAVARVLKNRVGPMRYLHLHQAEVKSSWSVLATNGVDGDTETVASRIAIDLGGGLALPAGSASDRHSAACQIENAGAVVFAMTAPNGSTLTIETGEDASGNGAGCFALSVSSARCEARDIQIDGVPVFENGQVNVWRRVVQSSSQSSGQSVMRKLSLMDSLRSGGSADSAALIDSLSAAFSRG